MTLSTASRSHAWLPQCLGRLRWHRCICHGTHPHDRGEDQRLGRAATLRAPRRAGFRVPVKGCCAEGSRKVISQVGSFLGSKRLPASGKPIRKVGGLRPPPLLMGFPEAGGRFDSQNQPIWAFINLLPSAQLPFTGTRRIAATRCWARSQARESRSTTRAPRFLPPHVRGWRPPRRRLRSTPRRSSKLCEGSAE